MNAIARVFVLVSVLVTGALAQWLNYPTAGLPRTRDGKPDLAAPTPKTAAGKPDLSRIWLPAALGIYFVTPVGHVIQLLLSSTS